MPRDEAYLLDILIAARRVLDFTAELTWEEFHRSQLHQFAAVKALEIIGEAASKISEEIREAPPEIPWREMIGMRNRLIHEYTRIDVTKSLGHNSRRYPPLIATIHPLVPGHE